MSAAPANSARQRWLIPALIVVVSLTVGGGLLARELYKQQGAREESTVVGPASRQLPADQQPGPPAVELTPDASAHPQDEVVRALFQTYFDAINQRDYQAWTTTVTTKRAGTKTQNEWLKDYRTTRNGSILVYRIEAAADDELRVHIGFTSTQDPSDAPVSMPESCIRWQLTLPLVLEGGDWKLATVPAGTTPEHSTC